MATKEEIKQLAIKLGQEAGVSPAMIRIGVAVLYAESGLNPNALLVNKGKKRYSDGVVKNTRDIGIAQFNDYWYWDREKIISPEDALIPEKALKAFWRYFPRRPKNWIAFVNKSYLKYLNET